MEKDLRERLQKTAREMVLNLPMNITTENGVRGTTLGERLAIEEVDLLVTAIMQLVDGLIDKLALLSVPVGWPKKKILGEKILDKCEVDGELADRLVSVGFNEAIDTCLLAHNSIIAEKDKEIAELKEKIKLILDNPDCAVLNAAAKLVEAKDSEIAKYKDEIESQANQIEELELEIARLRNENKELKEEVQALSDEIDGEDL